MSDEEILKKALEKAVDNGFYRKNYGVHLYAIIFSHDFAKALWGSEDWCDDQGFHAYKDCLCEYGHRLPRWMAELKILVLEEEPLKYLEKFLEESND